MSAKVKVETISFRVTTEQAQKVRSIARGEGMSVSRVCALLVERARVQPISGYKLIGEEIGANVVDVAEAKMQ